jgi:hypothetical protein
MNGYFTISRQATSLIHRDNDLYLMYVKLVEIAAFRKTNKLKRGQAYASVRFLSNTLSISHNKAQRCLNSLIDLGLIERVDGGSIITICDYECSTLFSTENSTENSTHSSQSGKGIHEDRSTLFSTENSTENSTTENKENTNKENKNKSTSSDTNVSSSVLSSSSDEAHSQPPKKPKKETLTRGRPDHVWKALDFLQSKKVKVVDIVPTNKAGHNLTGDNSILFQTFWYLFDYKTGRAGAAWAWRKLFHKNPPDMELSKQIFAAAIVAAKGRPDIVNQGLTPKMGEGWLSNRTWEDEQVNPTLGRTEKPILKSHKSINAKKKSITDGTIRKNTTASN